MRHNVGGRKLGRSTSHRVAMLRNLANSVILQEQVLTGLEKAKEARKIVDRLITVGKTGDLHSKRLLFSRTRDRTVVTKICGDLAERYKSRAGGYTRVLRYADFRRGDAAEMAFLELVDRPELNRKRKKTAADASSSTTSKDAKTAEGSQPADPFVRFRRLFGKKKSDQKK